MKTSLHTPNTLTECLPLLLQGEVPEVQCAELSQCLNLLRLRNVLLLDVRRDDEFNNELGHIPGAQLFTLGEKLSAFLKTLPAEKEIVFICRSGARSTQATLEGQALGLHNTVNLQGGMLAWNDLKLKTERF